MFKNIKEFEQLASLLLTSGLQVHVFHLQTKSFAEHMALGTFYDEIVDLSDASKLIDFSDGYVTNMLIGPPSNVTAKPELLEDKMVVRVNVGPVVEYVPIPTSQFPDTSVAE
jgi:hypothetical protein